ncbi:MAG: exosortase family protein XrtF, partial [Chryseobacterium sp.]
MKKYLIQFKPFLVFLSTFFSVYILLTLLYKVYLNEFKTYEVDGITSFVGRNVEQVLRGFNYDAKVLKNSSGSWLEVFLNNEDVV